MEPKQNLSSLIEQQAQDEVEMAEDEVGNKEASLRQALTGPYRP
jgi:hypothetical protein